MTPDQQAWATILALGFLGVLIMVAGAAAMTIAERRAGRRWGK